MTSAGGDRGGEGKSSSPSPSFPFSFSSLSLFFCFFCSPSSRNTLFSRLTGGVVAGKSCAAGGDTLAVTSELREERSLERSFPLPNAPLGFDPSALVGED